MLSCWGKEEKGHSAWLRHLEEYHSPDQELAMRLSPRSERGTKCSAKSERNTGEELVTDTAKTTFTMWPETAGQKSQG